MGSTAYRGKPKTMWLRLTAHKLGRKKPRYFEGEYKSVKYAILEVEAMGYWVSSIRYIEAY